VTAIITRLTRASQPTRSMRLQRCAAFALLVAVAACDTSSRESGARADSSSAKTRDVDLLGAGATFPYPLYARWFNTYATETGVRVNYQSIGSGGGIDQLIAGSVDFGASDAPMSDEDIARVPTGRVVHIPTVLGAVAITYNVPELERPLRVSSDILADIFLGVLTRWNDPRIAALNPEATLPDREVLVVHRSDGSGTSYIFSDYLTVVSANWAAGPGRSKNVAWPIGTAGQGNEGVAGHVKQTLGAIGYVESSYARQNRLPIALVRNAAGNFVSPSAFEMSAAATSALAIAEEPLDLRLSIVNAPGDRAYPISSFTWMLVAPEHIGPAKTQSVQRLAEWALHSGDQIARELGYEPIPAPLADRMLATLARELRAPK
jgi:phosphate transport system substrate-binding protein